MVGYKLHPAIDTKSRFSIAIKVIPAHVNDGDEGPTLMKRIFERFKPRFFMLDAAMSN
ncbi:transposase [Paenibacillus odorifer]|uniref:transposase n=1 Tax=Paenibacillus odorifer TaxID=189426 RepID=UPI002116070C|nr:transposase [Paenibacillus odorifer]